jgi:hypothetical protein
MDDPSDGRSDATRRQFLAGVGATAGVLVAGCAEDSETPTAASGTVPSAEAPDDGGTTVTGAGIVTTPTDAPPSPTSTATRTASPTATASPSPTPTATRSPSPSPTPTTPDSLDVDHTFPEKRTSRWWRFTVAAASEFTVEFTVTEGCPLDVFVLTESQLGTYTDRVEAGEDYRPFVSDNAPADVRFFDSEGAGGAAELSEGRYALVFHERCDPDRSVEFEFIAEIGAGAFDD